MSNNFDKEKHAKGLVNIGELILKFAKTNRVTLHEDGVTPESDTDHTVMLSVCACALADKLYKDKLDIGKVAQFALVHDLVEVYAGDTNSINLSDTAREEKEKKELESLNKIKNQFGEMYPWIHKTIEEYEKLESSEAKFIKTLDKAMSKITNVLNKGAYLKRNGTTREEIERHYGGQIDKYINSYGKEFPELIDIMYTLMNQILKENYEL